MSGNWGVKKRLWLIRVPYWTRDVVAFLKKKLAKGGYEFTMEKGQ